MNSHNSGNFERLDNFGWSRILASQGIICKILERHLVKILCLKLNCFFLYFTEMPGLSASDFMTKDSKESSGKKSGLRQTGKSNL